MRCHKGFKKQLHLIKERQKYRFWNSAYKYFLSTLCDLMSVWTCSAASSVLARIKTPVFSFSRLWQRCSCEPACMPSVIFASKGRHSTMLFLTPSTSMRIKQGKIMLVYPMTCLLQSCKTHIMYIMYIYGLSLSLW